MLFPQTTAIVRKRSQPQEIVYHGLPYGINKASTPRQLELGEMVECLNFKYNDDGKLVTRPGLTLQTTTTTDGAVTHFSAATLSVGASLFDSAIFDSTTFSGTDQAFSSVIMVTDDDNKVYYLDGTSLETIGTLADALTTPKTVSFGGYVIIFDGSYLKYWDGATLALCYDDGESVSARMYDALDNTDNSSRSLYSGATTMAGSQFTTPSWTTGLKVPCTSVIFMLSKAGSPTGTATCKLYNSTHETLLATSSAVDVTTLGTSAGEVQFDFTSQYGLSGATTYIVVVEYTGGDSGNYVKVHYDSAHSLGGEWYYASATWNGPGETNCPLMAVKPGLPPRSSFGTVWNDRLLIADYETPGLVRYSNVNAPFDWSSEDGGGYIGIIDSSGTSFPIGGMATIFGDLLVIGKYDTPYIVKISGTEPSDYAQSVMIQTISTAPDQIAITPNDVWVVNKNGVFSIRGVVEYGELRAYHPGEPVQNIITQHLTDDDFCAYNPIDGQLLIVMSGYGTILVCHTRRPVEFSGMVRYPWTEYKFKSITPTAMAYVLGDFYVGDSGGNIYKLNSALLDNGAQPVYGITSAINEMRFSNAKFNKYYAAIESEEAATADLNIYRNGSATELLDKELSIGSSIISGPLAFEARSVQWSLDSFTATAPVAFTDISFLVTPMEAKR